MKHSHPPLHLNPPPHPHSHPPSPTPTRLSEWVDVINIVIGVLSQAACRDAPSPTQGLLCALRPVWSDTLSQSPFVPGRPQTAARHHHEQHPPTFTPATLPLLPRLLSGEVPRSDGRHAAGPARHRGRHWGYAEAGGIES